MRFTAAAATCLAAALATPGFAQVTGVVLDAATQLPIVGALVTLQGTTQRTVAGNDGTFALAVTGGNLTIAAASKGYFTDDDIVTTPAVGIVFMLTPVVVGNDPNYQLIDPQTCGACHPDQFQQWTGSPMSKAGTNTWVYDLYDGTGSTNGLGGFVYLRDSVFAASHPASECASCHQPEPWVQQPGVALEPIGALSSGSMHGVSCEVCHKIANVDEAKLNFPGIFPGVVQFNRPPAPVTTHQVVYGGLGDATFHMPGVMRPSYQPELMAEVCGACHQDKNDPDGDGEFEEANGVISEPTYYEWLASPYGNPASTQYRSCVDCHMPPTSATTICSLVPVARQAGTIREHRIEGTTPTFLDNAAELDLQVIDFGFGFGVVANVENRHTGHHLPTGVTVRNMILLVEAWDVETGQRLPLIAGETLHPLAGSGGLPSDGYYAGLPGKLYAKVNRDAAGNSPTFFTDATSIAFDSRVPAGATDTTTYVFADTSVSGRVTVRSRLIYRRAWRALVDAKQWTTDGHGNPLEDVDAPVYGHLMEEAQWTTGAAAVAQFGSGCSNLAIDSRNEPSSGANDFEIMLTGASPSSPAVLLLGLSASNWAGAPLPADLTPIGAPGCYLLVALDALQLIFTDLQGEAGITLPIPHPAPLGATVFAQWAVPATNPLGWATSNGLEILLQR